GGRGFGDLRDRVDERRRDGDPRRDRDRASGVPAVRWGRTGGEGREGRAHRRLGRVGRDGAASRGAGRDGEGLKGERGFTLVESLLSSCLLLVGLLLSLTAYDAGKRSLAKSESLAEQQQAARTAFDQIVSRVRAAGLEVNPDSDPARP